MRPLRTLQALALLLCAGTAALAEDCGCITALPARLSLVWRDDGSLVAALVPSIERELRAVFEPLGLTIDWRVASTEEEASAGEILVLLLEDPQLERLAKGVMGAVRRGSDARRARVFLSTVEGLLQVGSKARGKATSARGRMLARALGRVAAHEVVHVIAPDLGHTREGLMQPSWTRTILAASRVRLDKRAAAAVIAGLVPEVPPSEYYASEAPSSSCTRSL